MRRAELIPGICVLVIALMGIVEGICLITERSLLLKDAIGAGGYIFGVSIIMMIMGVSYLLLTKYRKKVNVEQLPIGKEMSIKVVKMITVVAVYILLINVIGYLLASIVFFLLIFNIVGVKSWLKIFLLSITTSIVLYIIFIQLLRLVFPRGILFS